MVAVETLAYAIVAYGFIISLGLLFLEVDIGPSASRTGGIGLMTSTILALVVFAVYGPPPDIPRLGLRFLGGVLFVLAIAIAFSLLRWIANR